MSGLPLALEEADVFAVEANYLSQGLWQVILGAVWIKIGANSELQAGALWLS